MPSTNQFISCILLLAVTTCFAQPQINISTENWPPNNYLSSDGKIIGAATEKVHKIMIMAGVDHSIKMYPWARAYRSARITPNAAIYSIMRTKRREPLFQWVCPLIESEPVYFFRLKRRTDIKLDQLEDAKKYMISANRNEFDHEFLLQRGFKEEVDFDVTYQDHTAVEKLVKNRVELIIGTEYATYQYVKSLKRNPDILAKAFTIDISMHNPICMAFSLKTPKNLVDNVREALIKINQQ